MEEDAAIYLECELLLYGAAGAFAVARAHLVRWQVEDDAVRVLQRVARTRFKFANRGTRRSLRVRGRSPRDSMCPPTTHHCPTLPMINTCCNMKVVPFVVHTEAVL